MGNTPRAGSCGKVFVGNTELSFTDWRMDAQPAITNDAFPAGSLMHLNTHAQLNKDGNYDVTLTFLTGFEPGMVYDMRTADKRAARRRRRLKKERVRYQRQKRKQ